MNVYQGISAATGKKLSGDFRILQVSEVNSIVERAEGAYQEYQSFSGDQKAVFLETVFEKRLFFGN